MLTHSVVTAPSSLAVKLSVVKDHVRVSHSYDDDLLIHYVEAATSLVENYCSRALITQTLRMTSTGTPQPFAISMSSGPIAIYPMWFNGIIASTYRRLELIRAPLQSIVSVNVTHSDNTVSPLTLNNDFWVDTETDPGSLILGTTTLLPLDRITVVYNAGYGSTESFIPSSLKNAILWQTGYMYQHRGDDETNELPSLVHRLCDPYKLAFFGSVSQDGR